MVPQKLKNIQTERPSVALAVWTYVRKVLGSNLGRATAIVTEFSLVSPVPPVKCREDNSGSDRFFFEMLSNSSFTHHIVPFDTV
jgi:hypothetical protein